MHRPDLANPDPDLKTPRRTRQLALGTNTDSKRLEFEFQKQLALEFPNAHAAGVKLVFRKVLSQDGDVTAIDHTGKSNSDNLSMLSSKERKHPKDTRSVYTWTCWVSGQ